jgi:hypothetical protein
MTDMPKAPRNVWIARSNSLTRWRAEIDWIEVHEAQQGGRSLRLRLDGRETEIALTAEQASHLAGLLAPTGKAA